MSRQEAEKLLIDGNLINGLFLVRQSERSESDFALSFAYQKKCYHNRILKTAEGTFKNTKGSAWPSLSNLVMDYQSPHEDMQTIITNYVSNKPQTQDDGTVVVAVVAPARIVADAMLHHAKHGATEPLLRVVYRVIGLDSAVVRISNCCCAARVLPRNARTTVAVVGLMWAQRSVTTE